MAAFYLGERTWGLWYFAIINVFSSIGALPAMSSRHVQSTDKTSSPHSAEQLAEVFTFPSYRDKQQVLDREGMTPVSNRTSTGL